jgi:S-adenosylmethionine:tRNA ribosyltransferase-isomerase
MKVDAFDFHLPEHLIAQTPLANRSASRLMVVDRESSTIAHQSFVDLLEHVAPGDVLVLNDTKVLPARLIGKKTDTQATIELLLLHEVKADIWSCLAKPVRRLKVGSTIAFGSSLQAVITAIQADGIVEARFVYKGIFLDVLDALGEVPLPPYIKTKLNDPSRYQTVYANAAGSAAAPTAGLHFTTELLEQIQAKGVVLTYVTLHVGLGTFRPIKVDETDDHTMHSEFYQVSETAAAAMRSAKRIIAVGTTVARTLETMWSSHQTITACQGWSTLFITPGFAFGVVDQLITNFHLPKSTLMMLVSSFSSLPLMKEAYAQAIANEYRFFSFGDAMLIK